MTEQLIQPARGERAVRPSICFVSLNNFSILAGGQGAQHIGGAEVQQLHIARGLVARGYRVCFVTLDNDQDDGIEVGGIRIYKAFRSDAGVRGLRFVHPRWTGLWQAMRRADADVYYQRTAAMETGQVAAWCRLHGRKFIFGVASNANCDPALPGLDRRERFLYRWALHHVDLIVAQTVDQQRAMKQAFGCESRVIRSCCPVTMEAIDEAAIKQALVQPRVLWVGRFHPVKRLEWCLDLAAQCPHIAFDVVGQAGSDSRYAGGLLEDAERLPNVCLHGLLLPEALSELYSRCAVVLCTSRFEGFPNTFLEAWSHARPVLTTVDPDQVVSRYDLGHVAARAEELKPRLLELIENPTRYQVISVNALEYVRRAHSLDRVIGAYESVIQELVPL